VLTAQNQNLKVPLTIGITLSKTHKVFKITCVKALPTDVGRAFLV
jgi:hypothetical protein